MTGLLRVVAFAIALAGLIDPAISLSGASRARIAIVSQPSSAAAGSVRDRLARDLGATFEIAPLITSDAAAAIVIGDCYPEEPVPDALLIATVSTPAAAAAPGARIVRVDAPREIPPATVIHLDVELEGSAVAGQTSEVTAVIAGLEAGRASHRWVAGETRARAGIDAVPIGEAPYVITVRLTPDIAEGDRFSRTVADIVVDARRAPFRVEFSDARPSWATTFLRRALEGDARFQVATLGFTSRGVSATTGGAVPLSDARLDAFDVVIAGGLDRLSAADARALDRYMRERGGAVVVVPDQRIDADPARELILGPANAGHYPDEKAGRDRDQIVERLLEQPATLTVPLRVSELLVLRALSPGADVVARVPGDLAPVIVSMPRGGGRLLLSGAMDAWRYRAGDDDAFDRFWRSTIAGLALAVSPDVDIRFEPALLHPGERGEVVVRVRSHTAAPVSATLDGDQPIRLLPDPEGGVYRGRFTAGATPGRSAIDVMGVKRTVLVQADVHRVRPVAPSLAMLASSHRGIDVAPERVSELEAFVRKAVAAPRIQQVRHPMRSAWWILPFAFCLSSEWWIRRKRGLR